MKKRKPNSEGSAPPQREAGPGLKKPVSTDDAPWTAAYADCVGL